MKTIFETRDLTYFYDENNIVLNRINLKIKEGDCLAILGLNGSGKSTLLKILDGLIFPKKGEFFAFGKRVDENSFREKDFRFFFRKEVAFLFQNSDAAILCESVKEELLFTIFQLTGDLNEAEKRANDVAKLFEIEHLLNKSPHNLSEGQKKMVAFASLIPQNPSVILLDEPTSNLDSKNAKIIIKFIKEMASLKKSIILATHDINLVKEIGKRVVILGNEHSIAADGSIDDILNDRQLLEQEEII